MKVINQGLVLTFLCLAAIGCAAESKRNDDTATAPDHPPASSAPARAAEGNAEPSVGSPPQVSFESPSQSPSTSQKPVPSESDVSQALHLTKLDPLTLRPSYEDKFLLYWGRSGVVERAFPEYGKQLAAAPSEFKRHEIQEREGAFYAGRLPTMLDSLGKVVFATLLDAEAMEYDFSRRGYCIAGAGLVQASRINQVREGQIDNAAEILGGPEVMYEADPNGRRDSPSAWLRGDRGPVIVQFRNWIPECANGRGAGGVFIPMPAEKAEKLDLSRFVSDRRLFIQLFWRPILTSGDAKRIHANLVAYRVLSRTGKAAATEVAGTQVVGR